MASKAGADDLTRAHSRYQGTSAALRPYVVVLAAAHTTAARAVEMNHDARVRFSVADHDFAEAKREQLRLSLTGGSPAQIEQAEEAEHCARLAMTHAEHLGAEAATVYSRAVAEVDDAARTAMAAIDASFGQTNDSNWEEFKAAFAPIGDFLSGFAKWGRTSSSPCWISWPRWSCWSLPHSSSWSWRFCSSGCSSSIYSSSPSPSSSTSSPYSLRRYCSGP